MTTTIVSRNTTASFDRPVQGKLWVRLENGEEWEARPEDLEKFRLRDPVELYARFNRLLVEGLELEPGTDLTEGDVLEGANLVRYLAECALVYDHSPWADEHGKPWPEDDGGESFQERLRAYLLRAVLDEDALRDVLLTSSAMQDVQGDVGIGTLAQGLAAALVEVLERR